MALKAVIILPREAVAAFILIYSSCYQQVRTRATRVKTAVWATGGSSLGILRPCPHDLSFSMALPHTVPYSSTTHSPPGCGCSAWLLVPNPPFSSRNCPNPHLMVAEDAGQNGTYLYISLVYIVSSGQPEPLNETLSQKTKQN